MPSRKTVVDDFGSSSVIRPLAEQAPLVATRIIALHHCQPGYGKRYRELPTLNGELRTQKIAGRPKEHLCSEHQEKHLRRAAIAARHESWGP